MIENSLSQKLSKSWGLYTKTGWKKIQRIGVAISIALMLYWNQWNPLKNDTSTALVHGCGSYVGIHHWWHGNND